MSIDVGWQRMIDVELQAAADAASAAGATYLDGTSENLQTAIDKAVWVGNLNTITTGFELAAGDVEVGVFDRVEGSFTPVATSTSEPGDVNAVRVTPETTTRTWFAELAFGTESVGVSARSTSAVLRGGVPDRVECYLPFSLPACLFEEYDEGTNPPPIKLENDSTNTLGWGLPGGSVSTNSVSNQLLDQCSGPAAETDDDGVLDELEDMEVANGVNNAAIKLIADGINGVAAVEDVAPWPTALVGAVPDRDDPDAANPYPTISDIEDERWGYNVRGVVPIVDVGCTFGTGGVTGVNFTGSAPIVGYTYTYIYDVHEAGDATDSNLWMQFDFVNDYEFGSGQCQGDCLGNVVGTLPPALVQ